jgi:phage host-nuclease inhibitor protein Gam
MKITSWDQANQALRELGEARIAIGTIEDELCLRTNVLRDQAESDSEPLARRVAELEAALEAFASEHTDELDPGARSRKLTFGVLGWERGKPYLKIRSLKTCLEKLLESKKWKELYVREKPEVNREALKAAPPEVLKAVGAKIDQDDNFFARPDTEQLRATN